MREKPSDHPDTRVRQETAADVEAVHGLVAAAFAGVPHSAPPAEPGGPPGEATLLDRLRADAAWLPELSLVAEADDELVGHVVCSRGRVGEVPVLGLGPVSVHPAHQRRGIGSALVRAVLEVADQRDESLVALLGDPAFYAHFGFRPATELSVTAPEPAWGEMFQALALGGRATPTGRFAYAAPFQSL